jgi:predicted permease
LWNLHGTVKSLQPETILQFDVDPKLARIEPSRAVPLFEEMIAQIESIPGVRSASVSSRGDNFLKFTDSTSGRVFLASYFYARENFFSTMGIQLLAGRSFDRTDDPSSPKVVVVNEAFAHKYFPDVSPLGKTANGQIVGVVRDTKLGRFRRDVQPMIYYPYRQAGYGRMTFRIRTGVEPSSIIPFVREAVQKTDSHLPLSNVGTFADQVDQGLAVENMFAGLSTLFGVLALVLTCVGFYGVMTYNVARRTNEIGVRMALGAGRFDVLQLILNQGLVLVMIGSALGVAIAVVSSRFVASVLYGLAPDDGFTIGIAVLVIAVIAALAAFIPARKASRIDPLAALRYE